MGDSITQIGLILHDIGCRDEKVEEQIKQEKQLQLEQIAKREDEMASEESSSDVVLIVVIVICSVVFVVILLIVLLFILNKRKQGQQVSRVQVLDKQNRKMDQDQARNSQSLPNIETDDDVRLDSALGKDKDSARATIVNN